MPENTDPHKLAELEALLFIHGEPLPLAKAGRMLGVPEEELAALASELAGNLESADRGLALLRDSEKLQLVTKPAFHKLLESFVRGELSEDLTPASLETMSIIAYFGPISRSRIEYQRGVNSSFILRNLILRGLVERFQDPESAHSFLYRPTFDFWKHLGVSRPEDLPEFEKFKGLFLQFESADSNP